MRRFELLVDVLGAADEADGGEAVAVVALGLFGRLDDGRVIGEAEVVVRGEHDHLAVAFDVDDGVLRPLELQLALERPGLLHLIELGLEGGEEGHGGVSFGLEIADCGLQIGRAQQPDSMSSLAVLLMNRPPAGGVE